METILTITEKAGARRRRETAIPAVSKGRGRLAGMTFELVPGTGGPVDPAKVKKALDDLRAKYPQRNLRKGEKSPVQDLVEWRDHH